MKIKRRHSNESVRTFVFVLLILIPLMITSQLFLLSGVLFSLIIFAFFFSILYFFLKKDDLQKDELKYLQENAAFKLQLNKSRLFDYLLVLLLLASPFLNLNFSTDQPLFMLNTLIILAFLIYIVYNYVNNKHYSVENLYFSSSQIAYLGRQTIVINIKDIEAITIKDKALSIKEKHGNLDIELKKLDAENVRLLEAQIKELIY